MCIKSYLKQNYLNSKGNDYYYFRLKTPKSLSERPAMTCTIVLKILEYTNNRLWSLVNFQSHGEEICRACRRWEGKFPAASRKWRYAKHFERGWTLWSVERDGWIARQQKTSTSLSIANKYNSLATLLIGGVCVPTKALWSPMTNRSASRIEDQPCFTHRSRQQAISPYQQSTKGNIPLVVVYF